MSRMKQLEKLDGFGNVQMVEVEIPEPASDQILVKVNRSLISRGSELFRRYVLEHPVNPNMMGYSDAGEVVSVGSEVRDFSIGQRVMVGGPHAQYVVAEGVGSRSRAFVLPDEMSFETATFLPLTTSSVMWIRTSPLNVGETVVVLGQGIVGTLCAQIVREKKPGCVIVVDAQPLRCNIARQMGYDEVIDVSITDSVAKVKEITGGIGADLVIECVGGDAGIRSFEQALQMLAPKGTIHLIALYQGGPLPLDASAIMNKQLIAGIRIDQPREECTKDAATMLTDGRVNVSDLITHRLPWEQTPDAYHLLYNKPDEALGVILEWD